MLPELENAEPRDDAEQPATTQGAEGSDRIKNPPKRTPPAEAETQAQAREEVTRRRGEPQRIDPRDAATWPEVMTPDEVAAAMRMNSDVIRGFMRDGKLPARKVGGSWVVTKTRLLAFLSSDD